MISRLVSLGLGHKRRRRALFAFTILVLLAHPVCANDLLQRTVAYVEAITPAAVLLAQGVETPPEYIAFVGSVTLLSVPNILLLTAEARDNGAAIMRWRFVSAAVGLLAGGVGLVGGIAASAGALDDWGLRPYAGSLLAWSLPALLAGIIDLLPYEAEPDSR
ncbi:MAG: hypothetical protein ACLFP4_03865 [Spirochaetales bacterium]